MSLELYSARLVEVDWKRLGTSGVYRWLNVLNGKVYIGKSKKTIRGRNIDPNYRGNSLLRRAIEKYGEENFEIAIQEIILQGTLNEEEFNSLLIGREQYWIDYYRSWEREFGYNLSPTARDCSGVRHGQEMRRKKSEGMKKKWTDPEFRELATEQNKLNGQNLTTREKMKESARKRWQDPEYRAMMLEKTKKKSEEHKEKISETIKLKWQDPEYRKRLEEAHRISAADPERRKELSEQVKKAWQDPEFRERQKKKREETKEKRSEISKELWEDPEYRKKTEEAHRKAIENPERGKKISDKLKEKWKDPEFKEKQKEARLKRKEKVSESLKKAMADPEYRKQRSEIIARLWKDPEFREKMLKSRREGRKRRESPPDGEGKNNETDSNT